MEGSQTPASRPRLVVGVDGSPDSDRAVEWALARAGALGAVVHLLHAAPHLLAVGTASGQQEAEDSRRVMDRAAHLARRAPEVTVTTETVVLRAAESLVAASAGADAVVVGARGHGRLTGALTGSVSQHLARHAACPAVVVREPADRASSTVVVGVDESPCSVSALAFALRWARAEGIAVLAVRAWYDPDLDRSGLVLAQRRDLPEDLRDRELRSLDRVLEPLLRAHPHARVSRDVLPGHPQRVLTDLSRHAAAVVVGSRGRGGFAGLLLGSVGQALLQHAAAPVVVAR